MPRRLAWRVVFLMTALLAVPGAAAGNSFDRVGLVVKIDDLVGVPPAVMSKAKAETEVIFGAAGVRIAWQTDDQNTRIWGPDTMRLTLLVVKFDAASRRSADPIVGLAARASRRAFVFFDRLLDVAANGPVDTGAVLGRVMAHELGHLLLPPGPHASAGLMRSHIGIAAASPDRFSAAEARQLRSALMGGTAELTLSSSRAAR